MIKVDDIKNATDDELTREKIISEQEFMKLERAYHKRKKPIVDRLNKINAEQMARSSKNQIKMF